MQLKVKKTGVVLALLLPMIVYLVMLSMLWGDYWPGKATLGNVFFALVILLFLTIGVAGVVNELNTKIDDDGVTKRFVLWKRQIAWDELTSVRVEKLLGNIWKIELAGHESKITVNAFFFSNVNEIVRFLKRRISPEKSPELHAVQ